MIPFDAEFAARPAAAVHRRRARRRARRHARSRSARTSASATAPRATPACWRADPRFETVVHPLLEIDGEIVSSSHIRGLVLAGELAEANRLLGSPFQLRGEVVHGDARGRELGFPTANLIPDESLVCPGHGVYACLPRRRLAPGRPVSIGVRPTFNDRPGRADRGLHPRLRRRPLRQRAAPRLPRAPARRAALRRRRARWSSRCGRDVRADARELAAARA